MQTCCVHASAHSNAYITYMHAHSSDYITYMHAHSKYLQGYKTCTLEYLLYSYKDTSHACKSPTCKPCMHRSRAPPTCANSSDLLKLRLARLSFALSNLLSLGYSQLRNSPKLPTCLTSLLYHLLLRTAGPTTWAKALPCTLEDLVLSLSLSLSLLSPSCVSLLLTYKREGTEGNRGDFLFSHSTLMELSLMFLLLPPTKLGSYTHLYAHFCCKNHAHTP
jgi:hypothetical protein